MPLEANATVKGYTPVMQKIGAPKLEVADDAEIPSYKVYIYNLLALEHKVEQPPLFARYVIHPCEEGQPFSVQALPSFMKEPRQIPGEDTFRIEKVDSRKAAGSLLNPSSLPSTDWKQQLLLRSDITNVGNNLNAYGVFWSLTPPDSPKLSAEIEKFRAIAKKTMEGLVAEAKKLVAGNRAHDVTPYMHFAMDYLGLTADWHQKQTIMALCPTCGEQVQPGIVFHKNSFGERCIVDYARAKQMGLVKDEPQPEAEAEAETEQEPVAAATGKKAKNAAK